jgi:uncharacterized protein YycO
MQIAFFKAKYGNWKHKLTSWVTWGPYSHCELVLEDGLCISSTPEEGVCCRKIDFDPVQWDFIQWEESSVEDSLVFESAYELVGEPYDWKGVFLPHGLLQDGKRWYCSELIAYLLLTNGIWDLSVQCSPNYLFRQMYKDIDIDIIGV